MNMKSIVTYFMSMFSKFIICLYAYLHYIWLTELSPLDERRRYRPPPLRCWGWIFEWCDTMPYEKDIVLASSVPIIRGSCINGRWRNVLSTGKGTKIAFNYVSQRKWIQDWDGSKLSIERAINLEKRTKYQIAIYQL